jgi:hypothetical protein
MQDLEINFNTCVGLLKKLPLAHADEEPSTGQDEESAAGHQSSPLEAVARRLLRSRRRLVGTARGSLLLANVEGSALGLNMLLRVSLQPLSYSHLSQLLIVL